MHVVGWPEMLKFGVANLKDVPSIDAEMVFSALAHYKEVSVYIYIYVNVCVRQVNSCPNFSDRFIIIGDVVYMYIYLYI